MGMEEDGTVAMVVVGGLRREWLRWCIFCLSCSLKLSFFSGGWTWVDLEIDVLLRIEKSQGGWGGEGWLYIFNERGDGGDNLRKTSPDIPEGVTRRARKVRWKIPGFLVLSGFLGTIQRTT